MTRRSLLTLAILISASTAVAAPDPDSPEAERATFKVAEGFDVSLFASEADGVVKPIQMRFDARGRVWVVGSSIYPQIEPGQKPDDKVLILEDTNGDGKSDKTTVFADGLTIPTGIELGDGGAYVGHGTQLLHLKDTDGDGRANTRRVVLGGFGTGDSHQNINSFSWGPGGELWFCQGLSIRSRVETPWGIVSMNKAGLWRLYPRRLKLEPFYGSELEPQNPWGYAFTEWGEPISIAGNSSSITYPAPALVPNRREVVPVLIWPKGNMRKNSGGAFVGNAHWPKAWQGKLILGGYLNNAVWTLDVNDDGAGFALTDSALGPVIASSSQSFRPVDVKFGPDGSLYVCDWYNTIIGHYQNSFWDKRRDRKHGRIWRVTARNRPLVKRPDLSGASVADLLDQLSSQDSWARYFAKRVLADKPADEVTSALREWISKDGRTEHELVEALGVFQSHEVVEPELLARLCRASEPGARAYAAGVVGAWADRLPDPLAQLRPLVNDPNPRVRMKAMVSCAYVRTPEAIEVALVATDHPRDAFVDYALVQAVYSLKPEWLEPFKSGKLRFDGKSSRVAAFVRADGTPDTREAVRAFVRSPDVDAASREGFLRILADVGSGEDLAYIVNLDDSSMKGRLLPAVAQTVELRRVALAGDTGKMIDALLTSRDEAVRAGGLRLAAALKLAHSRAAAERIATDARESATVRAAAVDALPALGADRAVLAKLAESEPDAAVRAASIGALAAVDLNAAANAGAAFLAAPAPDAAAESTVRALFKREGAAASLTKAMSSRKPTPDAAKIALRVMSAVGEHDEALVTLLHSAAGLNREPKQLSESDITALADEARSTGEAAHGAQVFLRPEMSCATCHAVNGTGGKIGPDLGNVGTAQTLEFIIGALVMPNREVKEGYVAHDVLTKRGERYQAYVLREDGGELLIRDIATDRQIRIRKDEVKRRVQRGSPMPPGLTDTLTRAELRDLVAYLGSLGQAKVGGAGNGAESN